MGLIGDKYLSLAKVPKEKLKKELLNQLVLLPGIRIDLDGRYKDSKDIIGRVSSTRDMYSALNQLRQILATNRDIKLATVTNNNLGCAYAKLYSYQEAEEAFDNVINQASPGSPVREAAQYNLGLVKAVADLGT